MAEGAHHYPQLFSTRPTEDFHARLARDITHHLGQLEMHLLESFLHVLHRT